MKRTINCAIIKYNNFIQKGLKTAMSNSKKIWLIVVIILVTLVLDGFIFYYTIQVIEQINFSIEEAYVNYSNRKKQEAETAPETLEPITRSLEEEESELERILHGDN